ncbi:MAG: hypothetical protein AB1758_02905 [Candidatus Eremiobacterota bacterium]
MKRLFALLLLVWLAVPLAAEEAPSRVDLPDPLRFIGPDTVAIAVARARGEDEGFRQLINRALTGAREAGGAGSLGALLNTFLSVGTQESMLLNALPLQWVRVDTVGPDGQLNSCVAITLAGWRGLQSLVYSSMVTGKDGKPYELRRHRNEDIVLREDWQNPRSRMVFTRVKGTFLNCATPDQARYLVDRLLSKELEPVANPLQVAYGHLDRQRDSYGVVLNRNGSLMRVLEWVNRPDTARVRQAVGSERLDRVASTVESASWTADVVSDDRVDIDVTFVTRSPEEARELAGVVEEAREVLDQGGRMGDFTLTLLPDGRVQVGFAMIGFRERVSRYLRTVTL